MAAAATAAATTNNSGSVTSAEHSGRKRERDLHSHHASGMPISISTSVLTAASCRLSLMALQSAALIQVMSRQMSYPSDRMSALASSLLR